MPEKFRKALEMMSSWQELTSCFFDLTCRSWMVIKPSAIRDEDFTYYGYCWFPVIVQPESRGTYEAMAPSISDS